MFNKHEVGTFTRHLLPIFYLLFWQFVTEWCTKKSRKQASPLSCARWRLSKAVSLLTQRHQIQQLASQVERLTEGLSLLMDKPHTPDPSPAMPAIPKSGVYSGDSESCKGFLLQCKMYFEAYPTITEAYKYTNFHTLLSGKALKWASAVFNNKKEKCPFDVFLSRFSHVFDQLAEGKTVSEQLFAIKRGSSRASDYALEFHVLVVESKWNEVALQAAFRQEHTEGISLQRRSHVPRCINRSPTRQLIP